MRSAWLMCLLANLFILALVRGQNELQTKPSSSPSSVFSPLVTATCRMGVMTVKLETLDNFVGVIHSRDFRKPQCTGYGENTKVTYLRVNVLANKGDKDYCGVFRAQPDSEARSLAIAVRTHRSLELVDDKFYMITCGKAGFQNSRNQTSLVSLELRRGGRKVDRVVYGRSYSLRAEFSRPDGEFQMRVRRCFSFSDTNNTVQLVDPKGCPDPSIMSEFVYDSATGSATARIHSMFKFPDSHRLHFQCDIVVCREACEEVQCDSSSSSLSQSPSLDPESLFLHAAEDGALLASYSVFVVEPGLDQPQEQVDEQEHHSYPWLFWLCIVFGVLFLLMLLINVFLCTAMTCSCTRVDTDDHEKNDKSDNDEFDPYTLRSWHGSQLRYNNGLGDTGLQPIPPPLISVEPAASSASSSDSYPAVYGLPARPTSRSNSVYSGRSRRQQQLYGGSLNYGYNVGRSSSSEYDRY